MLQQAFATPVAAWLHAWLHARLTGRVGCTSACLGWVLAPVFESNDNCVSVWARKLLLPISGMAVHPMNSAHARNAVNCSCDQPRKKANPFPPRKLICPLLCYLPLTWVHKPGSRHDESATVPNTHSTTVEHKVVYEVQHGQSATLQPQPPTRP